MKSIYKSEILKKKVKSNKIVLSIVMLILFTITNIVPMNVWAFTKPNTKVDLGDIDHYNAIVFGTMTPINSEIEGALAVKGDFLMDPNKVALTTGKRAEYTIGGAPIGEEYDKNLPMFVLNGVFQNQVVYPNKQSEMEKRATFNFSGLDIAKYKNPAVILNQNSDPENLITNVYLYKDTSKRAIVDKETMNSFFEKMRSEVDNAMVKASKFSADNINNGDNNFKFGEYKADKNILVNSELRDVDTLNMKDGVRVPYLGTDKFLIIYSKAKKVKINPGSGMYFQTSNNGSYMGTEYKYSQRNQATAADTYVRDATKRILFVLPNATEITVSDEFGANVFAPNATLNIDTGTLNGQVFVDNIMQYGGGEVHNFRMAWSKWRKIIDPETKTASIKLIKKSDSSTGDLLPGAVFELKDSKGNKIVNKNQIDGNYTTDSKGEINVSDLPLGTYNFTEVKAPIGYEINKTTTTFELNKDKATVANTVINKAIKSGIKLTKVDKDNNLGLEGVEFSIYKDDGSNSGEGTFITNITTSVDGVAKYSPLPIGTYYIKEKKALSGYILNEDKIKFTLTEADKDKLVDIGTIENEKAKIKVQALKVDADNNDLVLEGAEFKLINADTNLEVNPGKIYKTNNLGLTEEVTLVKGNYYFEEVTAPKGYKSSGKQPVFSVNGDEKNTIVQKIENLKIEDPKEGSLRINKKGNINGENLKDVKFALLDSNKQKIDTLITDVNGIAIKKKLPLGKYYIQEEETNLGYKLDSTIREVNIVEDGSIVEINLTNEVYLGKARIVKIDKETGKHLQGAEFKIVSSDGSESGVYTTNSEGIAEATSLKPGSYKFIETKAPKGYKLDQKEFNFEVKLAQNGDTVEAGTLENELIKGSVILTKVDADDKDIKLEGAQFRLYNSDDIEIDSKKIYTTNNQGEVKVSELPLGSYYFKEIAAPKNYKLDSDKHWNFKIENEDEYSAKTSQIEVTNIKNQEAKLGSLKITKIGNLEGEKLEGVKFALLDSNKEKIDTLVTDSNGLVTRDKLPIGRYYIQEVETKLGYKLNSELVDVTISDEHLNIEKTIVNEFIPGQVLLTKEDIDTGELKGDAHFKLFNELNKELGEYKTNENGIVLASNLKPGKYYFKETKAPYGYHIDTTPINFEITLGNKSTSIVKAKNKIKLGKVSLLKVDSENGNVLKDVQFKLLNENGDELGVYTTNDEGRIIVDSLRPGKYSFVENKAPTGYELDKTPISFEIDLEPKEEKKITFKNTKEKPIEKEKTKDKKEEKEEKDPKDSKEHKEVIAVKDHKESKKEINSVVAIIPKTGDILGSNGLLLISLLSLGFGIYLRRKR